jgi:ketosteroid isomerase-like protein
VNPRDALVEIEQIKKLKARYCRLLDTKDWAAWRELFTDDFVSDTSPAGGKRIAGGDDFVAYVSKVLKPSRTTVHMVHTPEIEIVSPTTATGIWALEDFVRFAPGVKLRGYGHYTETYRKTDDGWKIASSTLTRVRQDLLVPLITFQIPDRLTRRP